MVCHDINTRPNGRNMVESLLKSTSMQDSQYEAADGRRTAYSSLTVYEHHLTHFKQLEDALGSENVC